MCTITKLILTIRRPHWGAVDQPAMAHLPEVEVSYKEPNSFQKQYLPETVILDKDGPKTDDLPTAFVAALQQSGFALYQDKFY